jgi:multidrug efflux pump subunit AcrA (membrane-fusion protein)
VREILAPGSEGHSSRIIINISSSSGVRAGQVITGEVTTSLSHRVIMVPQDCLMSELDGQADVFVADGSSVRQRPVQLGSKKDGLVTVQTGLTSGDQVVLHPTSQLRDGSHIKVVRVYGGSQ